MNQRKRAVVQVGLLFVALCTNAAVKNNIRIKILDSETRSVVIDDSGVPKNCDQVNFDAYCHNSRNMAVTNTLLVQEGDNPPFRITCTIDTKFSRCMPLPKGESFDARREKRGLTVYFVDDKGKERRQLYTLVASDKKLTQAVPVAAVATEPVSPPHTAAAVQSSPAPATAPTVAVAPAPSPAAAQGGLPGKVEKGEVEKVRCKFGSTPPGAEITLDGQYVGSTPSEISISTGTHVVLLSMPGFAQWKRELTVSPGSELTVSAI